MFQRRIPRPFWSRVSDFFWPNSGWTRAFTYLWHRLCRLPGGSYSIAAGFASGAAVSFLPLSGLHFILAAVLAWSVRGNIIASALGTVVGNPWTFPAIWVASYAFGLQILGIQNTPTPSPNFVAVFEALWYGVRHWDMGHIMAYVWPIWWPMMVGSVPMAIVAWIMFFWPLLHAVRKYENRKKGRSAKR